MSDNLNVDSKTIIEVLNRLIGDIEPTGDSSIDSSRLENLEVYGEVLIEMSNRLHSIVDEGYKYNSLKSMKDIIEKSDDILDRL